MSGIEQNGFKRWEDLDITDDFIFTRVMRNKRLCRTLLEMVEELAFETTEGKNH